MDLTQYKTFVFPHRIGGNGVYNVMDSLESRTTRKLEDFLTALALATMSGFNVYFTSKKH